MKIEWTARTSSEKAKARKLIKAGKAKLITTELENYQGKRGLVNYEAWIIEEFA